MDLSWTCLLPLILLIPLILRPIYSFRFINPIRFIHWIRHNLNRSSLAHAFFSSLEFTGLSILERAEILIFLLHHEVIHGIWFNERLAQVSSLSWDFVLFFRCVGSAPDHHWEGLLLLKGNISISVEGFFEKLVHGALRLFLLWFCRIWSWMLSWRAWFVIALLILVEFVQSSFILLYSWLFIFLGPLHWVRSGRSLWIWRVRSIDILSFPRFEILLLLFLRNTTFRQSCPKRLLNIYHSILNEVIIVDHHRLLPLPKMRKRFQILRIWLPMRIRPICPSCILDLLSHLWLLWCRVKIDLLFE